MGLKCERRPKPARAIACKKLHWIADIGQFTEGTSLRTFLGSGREDRLLLRACRAFANLRSQCAPAARHVDIWLNVRNWPITSASQFGPRPLLVEPDIAIGIDQSRMTQSGPRCGCQFALHKPAVRLLDHLVGARARWRGRFRNRWSISGAELSISRSASSCC